MSIIKNVNVKYDENEIPISMKVEVGFTENLEARFSARVVDDVVEVKTNGGYTQEIPLDFGIEDRIEDLWGSIAAVVNEKVECLEPLLPDIEKIPFTYEAYSKAYKEEVSNNRTNWLENHKELSSEKGIDITCLESWIFGKSSNSYSETQKENIESIKKDITKYIYDDVPTDSPAYQLYQQGIYQPVLFDDISVFFDKSNSPVLLEVSFKGKSLDAVRVDADILSDDISNVININGLKACSVYIEKNTMSFLIDEFDEKWLEKDKPKTKAKEKAEIGRD